MAAASVKASEDVGASETRSSSADSAEERIQTRRRTAIPATVVHGAILGEGEAELARHPRALAWSGLAAGISMGTALLAQGLLMAYLPKTEWSPLIYRFGYALGFLAVILGRQQLFTENTLTTLLPLLERRSASVFWRMARLWAIVLATNVLGAGLFALVAARTDIFPAYVRQSFAHLALEAASGAFWPTLGGAVVAGWLIALLVWLLPAASGESKMAVIVIFTYVIGLGGFAHVVAGSAEALYAVAEGTLTFGEFWTRFFAPALLGNVIGGAGLVTILNHEQVVAGSRTD